MDIFGQNIDIFRHLWTKDVRFIHILVEKLIFSDILDEKLTIFLYLGCQMDTFGQEIDIFEHIWTETLYIVYILDEKLTFFLSYLDEKTDTK